MKTRFSPLLAGCLLVATAIVSAQGFRPAPRMPRTDPTPSPTPRMQPIIALPICDPAELIELLDEFFAPVPETVYIAPEYCATRTCEAKAKALKYAKDARLLQDIDLMRLACQGYF